MGLLASLLVYRVATRPVDEQEKIVVASVNLAMAEIVKGEHVKLVEWPKRSVPAGALKDVNTAEGRIARSPIVAGEPLLEAKLAPGGKGGIMPILVPAGLRGVTIKVDDAIKESGFILPGSRVDILVSMAKDRSSQERFAKVILQDVQVLAAGQTVEMRDNKPVTVTTVTFALSPAQAERLALAQVEGKLMLATRNLGDNQLVQTSGVSTASLFHDNSNAAQPQRTPAAETRTARSRPSAGTGAPPRPSSVASGEPLPPPKLQTYTVSVLRAGKPSEHVFVRDEGEPWVEQKK